MVGHGYDGIFLPTMPFVAVACFGNGADLEVFHSAPRRRRVAGHVGRPFTEDLAGRGRHGNCCDAFRVVVVPPAKNSASARTTERTEGCLAHLKT